MVNKSHSEQNAFQFQTLGVVHSVYKEKFGTPRQPGLVPLARAEIEVMPPYDVDEAFRGLESVSHVWIVFVFHQSQREAWRPTVRPPRLGGNRRLGVFATRSNFRPNPIGLSLVRLHGLERKGGRLILTISGADLIEGTPVLDIKPYIPYADRAEDAYTGIADMAPLALDVRFSDEAVIQLAHLVPGKADEFRALIQSILSYDPRPAYQGNESESRQYGCRVDELNVLWTVVDGVVQVQGIEKFHES
ncbi:MAG: tRNA (N6-threonylcarbamoyladenosine(37)-N6)-methyltransferase TrmO [Gammaproteobacteria bacterium]|nr:tRNA (N6-threonylcarbamoyladenosine(37)-N6)-methyltransferase TrmO [Gammaproteobacteria bacterium]